MSVRVLQRLGAAIGASLLALAACSSPASQTAATAMPPELAILPATPPQLLPGQGVNLEQLSGLPATSDDDPLPSTVILEAGDDFYGYVNRDWLAAYKLPADKASMGFTEELSEKSDADVRALAEQLIAAKPAAGTLERKVADLYAAAMDEATIEKRGIEPLKPHLDRIRAVSNVNDLMRLMGVIGYASPVGAGIAPSPVDPDRNAIWVSQSGLGMPHRGYYLGFGVRDEALRVSYRKYVATVMRLIGNPDPEGAAARIYALERKIALAHTDIDRSLSAEETLRPTTLSGLKSFAPGLDWDLFLGEANFTGAKLYVVTDGTAVAACADLIRKEKLEDWKTWMEFHFANQFAAYLPRAFADPSFDFFTRQLAGVQEELPRWQWSVGVLNDYLGDGVGQLYATRNFGTKDRKAIDTIVSNIRSSFETRMRALDWMDEATRKEALNKLTALKQMVGQPDTWRDLSGVKIEPGKLIESLYNIYDFDWREQAADLNKPVDRARWPTPPHVINAFYNPLANTFVLPAGILQPPFFDPDADAAENYGGIGAIIGHEMSHGFDDMGRQFDETGKTRNWWTEDTDARFLVKSNDLIRQYNAYCPWFGACVNGLGTLGENIGDLAGLEISYAAYHASLGGKAAPVIKGLTGDQRFFIAYARGYRGKMREELARAMLDGDSHAPNRYRVNGVVRNMDAWYAAFNVQPGDRLYLKPEDRIRLW